MKSTREASKQLDISPAALRAHISTGNVRQPARRVGLSYLWTDGEIEDARQALAVPGRRRPHWFSKATAEMAAVKGAG